MTIQPAPPLSSGSRLGRYAIRRALGAGGMGEVYEAEDMRLHRRVALKVVRRDLTSDPARRTRLQREATAAASLNHSSIVTVYSLEEESGTLFITMELIEGTTLAEAIPPAGMPLDRLLALAIQIAEALAAAHASGIVHRDLKPANVMLPRGGGVKVLDFGLSRFTLDDPAGTASTIEVTTEGALLGTVPYISPEQIAGRQPDARADIFAFGVILYEMATGRQPFGGPTAIATLAAIAGTTPPSAHTVNPSIPEAVARVISRCLAKDPDRRTQCAADLQAQLEDLAHVLGAEPTGARGLSRPETPKGQLRRRAGILASATMVVVGAFALGATVSMRACVPARQAGAASATLPMMHTTIELPTAATLALGARVPAVGFESPTISISREGDRIAYVAATNTGTSLYVRELGGTEVARLAGTDGAIHPFFSPDRSWIGFLTDDRVKKVSVQGGAVTILSTVQQPVQAWWTDSGIYVSHMAGRQLSRISPDGAVSPSVVMEAAVAGRLLGGAEWRFSDVLPGGQTFLATRYKHGISGEFGEVVAVSPATGEHKSLLQFGYSARYVPGYLVFARAGGLMGVAFDSERLETVGQPVSLVSGVSVDSLWAQVHAAVSHSGVIAYVPGGDRAVGRPGWVNSTGATEYIDAPPARYGVFDLTRDGKRLAVIVADVHDYIWVYHLERGDGSRIAGVTSRDRPVWSPDGLSLAFTSFDGMRSKFMVQRVDGGEARELPVPESVVPDAWSPDGSTVAYSAGRLGVGSPRRELGFVSMDGDARTPGLEGLWTSFSPDGKWFAYNSPTMDEIWVASYPDATVRRRITDAGKEPVWCACGELFYRWGNRWYATTLSLGAEIHWSPPRVAFETDFIDTPGVSYRVSPDGKRLLVVKRTEPDTRDRLHVLTAWGRLMGG